MFSLMLVAGASAMPQHSKGFIPGAAPLVEEIYEDAAPVVYVEEATLGFVPVRTVTSYTTGELIEVDAGNLDINVITANYSN